MVVLFSYDNSCAVGVNLPHSHSMKVNRFLQTIFCRAQTFIISLNEQAERQLTCTTLYVSSVLYMFTIHVCTYCCPSGPGIAIAVASVPTPDTAE